MGPDSAPPDGGLPSDEETYHLLVGAHLEERLGSLCRPAEARDAAARETCPACGDDLRALGLPEALPGGCPHER